jgi:antitoxin ParD1/3/4
MGEAWYEYFILGNLGTSCMPPSIEKRTISLPAEHAAYVDAKVASGAYASASEVIRAGLRALQERDQAVERWLHEDVAPTFDRMRADPKRALPAKSAFANVRRRHTERLGPKT